MTLVGRHIGRYRILEQVGQGGMSVVYKGLDTTLDREVAVKVLHPHLAPRPESRKRLEREAKAVARLKHPNILEVYDFSAEGASEAYLVTEFIRGRTLREFITEEALQPPEVAAMVVHELASALAHAHEAGIIHRDLKPENVMVREDGVLKLMDFGIAKALDRDEKMTATGALVGSPAHMAPEIIEGEEAGAEADVFSMGTMLYLFATGKLPFTAPNTTATLKRILDCAYDDPRRLTPTVSDPLAEIIATCLQRQPGARYPSATRLRDALAEYLSGLGLTRPHEELPRFFLDPRGYRRELGPRITGALLAQAEAALAEKRSARAMSVLNQVLAHEPANARAGALLNQLRSRKQREARARRLQRGALVAGGLFIVAMATLKGFQLATRPAPFVYEVPLAPTDVTLAGFAWAPAPPRAPSPEAAPEPNRVTTPVEVPEPRPMIDRPPRGPVPRALEEIDVAVIVRPFGHVQVDGGPRSAEALARHALRLAPGPHRFTVTCDACEAQGRAVTVDVRRGEDVRLVAPLKPSLVSFQGWPDDAVVRVVGLGERTVREARERPFVVATPAQGSADMRHRVEYSVSAGGQELARDTRFAQPGQPLVITREAR